MDIQQTLHDIFGFSQFLPGQEEIIRRLEKNYSHALAGLASVYYRQGKQQQGDLFFKRAKKTGGLNSFLYMYRGLFYLKAGDPRQAIASFSQVRAGDLAQRAKVYTGIAWMRQRQYDRALEAFKSAMRMDPMDIRVRLHLADLLLKTNKQAAAENILRKAVAAMITDHFYTKILAWMQNNTDAAIKPDPARLIPFMKKMHRDMALPEKQTEQHKNSTVQPPAWDY